MVGVVWNVPGFTVPEQESLGYWLRGGETCGLFLCLWFDGSESLLVVI